MRILDLLFFCRPLLLIPVWTVYLLLFDTIHSGQAFSSSYVLNLGAISALTAAGYIINQIYDREGDRLNKKLGFFDRPVAFRMATGWMMYVALIVTGYTYAVVRPELLAAYSAAALAGWLYSAPPLRGKDRPWAGLALNAIPYSALVWWSLVVDTQGVIGAFTYMTSQTAFTLSSLATALAGIYLITTVPDITGDKSSGKRTIAVVFGKRNALAGAVLSLALALTFGFLAHNPALYLTSAVALALAFYALRTGQMSHILLSAKAPILLLSAFEIYRHPLYGIFLLALIALTRVYYKRRFGIVYPQMA